MSKPSAEAVPDRQQAENSKASADRQYEAGKISGSKYVRMIARANKVSRKRK